MPSSTPLSIERLVPLETWLAENSRNRSIWQFGSPYLSDPDNMGKWLKRHEKTLTEQGAVLRLGKAWRIVEPRFQPVMFSILSVEREREFRRQGKL